MKKEISNLAKLMMVYKDMFSTVPTGSLSSGITQFDFFVLNKFDTDLSKDGRIYLSDLGHELDFMVDKVSRLVKELERKGLVSWSHDKRDTLGTFIELTDFGRTKLEDSRRKTVEFYTNVMDKFGKEKAEALVNMMQEMAQIMNEELKTQEAG